MAQKHQTSSGSGMVLPGCNRHRWEHDFFSRRHYETFTSITGRGSILRDTVLFDSL